jgi:hypothetical protein
MQGNFHQKCKKKKLICIYLASKDTKKCGKYFIYFFLNNDSEPKILTIRNYQTNKFIKVVFNKLKILHRNILTLTQDDFQTCSVNFSPSRGMKNAQKIV